MWKFSNSEASGLNEEISCLQSSMRILGMTGPCRGRLGMTEKARRLWPGVLIVLHDDCNRIAPGNATGTRSHPQHAALGVVQNGGRRVDVFHEMQMPRDLAFANVLADIVGRLEESRLGGENVCTRLPNHHVARGRRSVALHRLRRALDDPHMLEDVLHSPPADTDTLDVDAAPAAQFGA